MTFNGRAKLSWSVFLTWLARLLWSTYSQVKHIYLYGSLCRDNGRGVCYNISGWICDYFTTFYRRTGENMNKKLERLLPKAHDIVVLNYEFKSTMC